MVCFDNHTSYFIFFKFSGQIYSSQSLDGNYHTDHGSIGLDGSLDNMDNMLLNNEQQIATTNGHNNVINPIDKLYSMQNSYFSAD